MQKLATTPYINLVYIVKSRGVARSMYACYNINKGRLEAIYNTTHSRKTVPGTW